MSPNLRGLRAEVFATVARNASALCSAAWMRGSVQSAERSYFPRTVRPRGLGSNSVSEVRFEAKEGRSQRAISSTLLLVLAQVFRGVVIAGDLAPVSEQSPMLCQYLPEFGGINEVPHFSGVVLHIDQ